MVCIIVLGEVIELHCNLDDQDVQVAVSKISRIQFQLEQGSFDINDACTDLNVNIVESLQTLLECPTEDLFTVGKPYLPELLKLKVTSASESEIRLELRASKSDNLPNNLWRDIRIQISSQVRLFQLLSFVILNQYM